MKHGWCTQHPCPHVQWPWLLPPGLSPCARTPVEVTPHCNHTQTSLGNGMHGTGVKILRTRRGANNLNVALRDTFSPQYYLNTNI